MKRFSSFKVALVLACITEGILEALASRYAGLGHGGPKNVFTIVFGVLHLPGIVLGAAFPDGSALQIAVVIAVGIATFTLGYWGAVSLWRRHHEKHNAASMRCAEPDHRGPVTIHVSRGPGR